MKYKRSMKGRIVAALLAVVMVVTLIPVNGMRYVSAEETQTEEGGDTDTTNDSENTGDNSETEPQPEETKTAEVSLELTISGDTEAVQKVTFYYKDENGTERSESDSTGKDSSDGKVYSTKITEIYKDSDPKKREYSYSVTYADGYEGYYEAVSKRITVSDVSVANPKGTDKITLKRAKISVNNAISSMIIDETKTVSITNSSRTSEYVWKSSDESIISVSMDSDKKSAVLTAEKAGNATITITDQADESTEKVLSISVRKKSIGEFDYDVTLTGYDSLKVSVKNVPDDVTGAITVKLGEESLSSDDGRTFSYSSTKKIDTDKMLTISFAGDDNYTDNTDNITSQKLSEDIKDVSDLINWSGKRNYNGSDVVELSGSYNGNTIADCKAEATISSSNAGSYTEAMLSEEVGGIIGTNMLYFVAGSVKADVTINKVSLKVEVSDYSKTAIYGEKSYSTMQSAVKEDVTLDISAVNENDETILNEEKESIIVPKFAARLEATEDKLISDAGNQQYLLPGSYEIGIEDVNLDNYEVSKENITLGKLTVSFAEIGEWSLIEGENAYYNSDTSKYYVDASTPLKLKPDDDTKLFDYVYVLKGDTLSANVTETGITPEQENTEETYDICFVKRNKNDMPIQVTASTKITVVKDTFSPEMKAVFTSGSGPLGLVGLNGISLSNNELLFQYHYQMDKAKVRISASDIYTDANNNTVDGSGIKSFQYQVIDCGAGGYASFTQEDLNKCAEFGSTTWLDLDTTSVNGTFTGEIDIPDDVSGYYVVVIKAVDRVGNYQIKSSNGLTFDSNLGVSLVYSDQSITVSGRETFTGTPAFSKNAYIDLVLENPKQNFPSGLSSIDVIEENLPENVRANISEDYTIYVKKDGAYSKFKYSFSDKTIGNLSFEGAEEVVIEYMYSYPYNAYAISYTVTSNYGTTKTVDANFMIDNVRPEISLSGADNNGIYKDEKVVTVNLTDKTTDDEGCNGNFNLEDVTVDITTNDGSKKYTLDTLDFTELGKLKYGINAGSAKSTGSTHGLCKYQIPLTFSGDYKYTVTIKMSDLATNRANTNKIVFTVDQTKPDGKIVFNRFSGSDQEYDSLSKGTVSFLVESKSVQTTVSGHDQMSGLKSIQYYKQSLTYKAGKPACLSGTELANVKWTSIKNLGAESDKNVNNLTADISSPNQKYVIYARIEDNAGNVTYINTKCVILDDKTPSPKITISLKPAKSDIYNSSVPFTTTVSEASPSNVRSGLKEVICEVYKDGVVTQSWKTNSKDMNTELVDYLKWDKKVNASKNNSNKVEIKVTATDHAGHEAVARKKLKIDITDPVVDKIKFDNNSATNKKYYNKNRTATITVKERNFDPNDVQLKITSKHGSKASVGKWSVGGKGGSDSDVNTLKITFSKDDDYTISFSCVDKANNKSNTQKVPEFTIDKTKPVIKVSYDKNKSNGYYNETRTATVTITEHNFSAKDVNAAITASLGGRGASAPRIGSWSSSGDKRTTRVVFSSDADYTFDIDYTDMAGNKAADYSKDSFTVDKTAPEIDIIDVKDGKAYNDKIAPKIIYTDTNYDANGVKITLKGYKHDEKTLNGTGKRIAGGEEIQLADFAHKKAQDDVYKLVAVVTDLAGNSTEKEISFSVNRFGSNFTAQEGNSEKLFNDYYVQSVDNDVVILETNVNKVKDNKVECGIDGTLRTLTEGTDYKVAKVSGSDTSWYQYQYTINKDVFENEGLYSISITSTDDAGNKMTNKLNKNEKSDFDFIVDREIPSVVVSGIENNKRYQEASRNVKISVSDNYAMSRVEIYLNDEETPVQVYDAETITEMAGELEYTINEEKDWQNFSVKAYDAADNCYNAGSEEGGSEVYRVLVTTNKVSYFIHSTAFIVLLILLLIVIILLIVWYYNSKKKKGSAGTK